MAANDGEAYACPAEECDRSFGSAHGRGQHVRYSHDPAQLLLKEIRRLADELGRTPTRRHVREHSPISAGPAKEHFDGWNGALRAAGVDINEPQQNLTSEDVIEAIQGFAEKIGRTPTQREMKAHGPISSSTAKSHFGTWNDALQEAGLDINSHSGVARGYSYINYGSNWRQQRREVVSRDGIQCRVCSEDRSDVETHSVHVHHITPAREFGAHDPDVDTDYEEMNDLSNLICLCPSCHRTLEGKFQDADPDEFAELGRERLGIDVEAEIDTTQNTTDGSVQAELAAASD